MKKTFLMVLLVGSVGSLALAGFNKADFVPKNDPNNHPNGARGASMGDYVMMAAEIIAVGAGLNGASEQPFATSSVQDPGAGDTTSLTKDTKGDEPETGEPGVEI